MVAINRIKSKIECLTNTFEEHSCSGECSMTTKRDLLSRSKPSQVEVITFMRMKLQKKLCNMKRYCKVYKLFSKESPEEMQRTNAVSDRFISAAIFSIKSSDKPCKRNSTRSLFTENKHSNTRPIGYSTVFIVLDLN
jgi:hypothetical protein